ncbi:MAG: hypothetical protein R3C68_14560 [Myxococcota bacterium]
MKHLIRSDVGTKHDAAWLEGYLLKKKDIGRQETQKEKFPGNAWPSALLLQPTETEKEPDR